MKKDWNDIRRMIDNSGVSAPEDMDAGFVLQALEKVEPKPVEIPKKTKRRAVVTAVSATAAVLVIAIAVGIVLRAMPKKLEKTEELKTITLSGGLALTQFGSYEEVRREVERLQDQSGIYYFDDGESDLISIAGGAEENAYSDSAGSLGGASSQSSAAGSSSHNSTYIQVAGVDEGDIIKTDGRYLYCVDHNYFHFDKIRIFSAEAENTRCVAEIEAYAERFDTATKDQDKIYMHSADYCGIAEIYLKDDRLIAVCDYTDTESTKGVVSMTRVNVYDISDISRITLLDSFSQSGSYIASRMIDDTVYLISTDDPWDEEVIPRCGNVPEELPADHIYGLSQPNSEDFLVISAYDTSDSQSQTESKAILGGIDDIYCNQNNLYVYMTELSSRTFGDFIFEDSNAPESASTIKSQILKIDLTDGIRFMGYTEVDGIILNQYAMDEYNGNLRVATTSATEDWTNTNNLFVLDENLNLIGSVTGFAKTESIHAVRYLEDTAFVITYEQTDPLFVIDLSTPTDPAILGEVEITGFSSMLVPIDENTLLGIGAHIESADDGMSTQTGLKLALFDVSDKSNPKVLDSKSYIDYDSEVQNNPRALVVNPERNDFVIPLNYNHWEEFTSSSGEYDYQDESVGGALNFKVENGKIVEIKRYQSDSDSVERCAYVGDHIYMMYYDEDDRMNRTLQVEAVPYQ